VANITKNDVGMDRELGRRVVPRRQRGLHGFFGVSHIQYAAWTTNAGQLIGAASEIEGAAPRPPPPPTFVLRPD